MVKFSILSWKSPHKLHENLFQKQVVISVAYSDHIADEVEY
jgi:hypothetical protein